MNAFFSMDGPFYKIGSIIADIMIVSFIWILFSLPIFTIGASSTALYYVMTRRISNREGYLWRDFWTSFKSNFKQTTIIWLIFLALAYILYVNIANVDLVGDMKAVILPVQVLFSVELTIVFMYIIPLNARFEIGLKDSFKTAFFMANRHLLTSILCLIVALGIFVVCYTTIILFLFAAGLYCYLTSFLFLRVFKKYRPEIDMDYAALEQFNAEKAEAESIEAETIEKAAQQNASNLASDYPAPDNGETK
ncbi:MAG: DUF624 domain-containing protein [Clostridiales bacterium]|jgi:uncharacterized membrane protein YesL|nr:DUF624 domain-containing protein [Clostridiales bacterium]